ncbi:NADH-quinone oxidoreductase subunit N [Thalassotalea atypica]|uniref:NADH-quinone oxidoreductase subunit N n=1 Tax=Thalassotalea atypica TaxID=2054316 RepID=UPI0025723678|nr:NADH-quinone oxidoreductase subunit N [Thalassotalea atypica]
MLNQILALSPQLIIALAITFMLLLIAMKRTQRIIQIYTCLALGLATIQCFNLLGIETTQVTILLSVSTMGIYAQILVYLSGLMVASLSYKFLMYQVEVHDEFYLLILLAILGASVLVVSDHFAAVFLGFEILSISLVGLVGYCREGDLAIESSFKYLILSAVASSFMLLGIAFIYGELGSLSFSSAISPEHTFSNFYYAGMLLFLLGVAFKLALAPLHLWVADVYQGAHTLVTLFMATVTKVAMFIVLLTVITSFSIFQEAIFIKMLVFISVLSMIIGNFLALRQSDVKRLLAYSSIAHMGYILVVVVITNTDAIVFAKQSALVYLFAYVLASMSVFYVVFQFNYRYLNEDVTRVDDFKGLFWKDRPLALLTLVGLLSLAGIPLSAGFIGKFYLFSHAVLANQWILIGGMVVGSGIGLFYYLTLIINLFSAVDKYQTLDNAKQVVEDMKLPQSTGLVTNNYSLNFVVTLIILGLAIGLYPDVLLKLIALT